MDPLENNPEQTPDVTDLETARLALRGALQSVHNLQDLNARLKGEIQDYLHREKALNERMIRLQKEINESYAQLDQKNAVDRERDAAVREALRQEVIVEQNQKWQTEIDALRQSVQNWNEVRRQKETELRMIKEALLQKESEVFSLQKEKIASEEKAHRDLVDAIAKARSGVQLAIDQVVRAKDHEITDLKKQVAEGPAEVERRMQLLEQDFRRKEQVMLLQFRERQQALELDWTQREKELWAETSRSRQTVEAELKKQWENRQKDLDQAFEARRAANEKETRQKERSMDDRLALREAELNQIWAAKESSLAQEWARREKAIAEEFQANLDAERQRAAEAMEALKRETDAWRQAQDETWKIRETEYRKAHKETEDALRESFRHREVDLLAKHQEALEKAQRDVSELLTRASDKDSQARMAMEKLALVVKERDTLSERFEFMNQDHQRRLLVVESQLKERTRQLESERAAHLEKTAALQADFLKRQGEMEKGFHEEVATLRVRLTALSQGSSEKEQTYQRRIAEVETELLQRVAQAQTLSDQLAVSRKDYQLLTQSATTRDAEADMRFHALEEKLAQRENNLQMALQSLEEEHSKTEQKLKDRAIVLEQDLQRLQGETRILEQHLHRSEEVRSELQIKTEALQVQLQTQDQAFRESFAEVERASQAARTQFEKRIVELEGLLGAKETDGKTLQARLVEMEAELKTYQAAAAERETLLNDRLQAIQQTTSAEKESLVAQLDGLRQKGVATQQTLEARVRELEAEVARRTTAQNDLSNQLQHLQAIRVELTEKAGQREAQLLQEIEQFKDRIQLQKDQLSGRIATLEQERHQTEEALQAKILDLQQQTGQRGTALKTVQDQLSKARELNDQLEKRLTTVEGHLSRAEQQLKGRETELHALISTSQKQLSETQEGYQRRLVEVQNQRLKLETDLKGVKEEITRAEAARIVFEKEAADRDAQWASRVRVLEEKLSAEDQQAQAIRQGLEQRIIELEGQLRDKNTDFKTIESRLSETSALQAHTAKEREALLAQLQDVQHKDAAVQQQLEARVREFEAEITRRNVEHTDLSHQLQQLEKTRQELTQKLTQAQESYQAQTDRLQRLHDKERQEWTRDAGAKETTMVEEIRQLKENIKTQKELLASRVIGLERERHQSEEALSAKILELEQRVGQKSTALKTIQDQLAKSRELNEQLEKRLGTVEGHLSRAEQQLKGKETELHSLISTSQKQLSETQEGYQRRLLDVQNQKLKLETDLKGIQEAVVQAQTARLALEQELAAREKARHAQETQWRHTFEAQEKTALEQHQSLQKRIDEMESQLRQRSAEIKTFEARLSVTEDQRQTFEKELGIRRQDVANLQKQLQQQQEVHLSRVTQLETQLSARLSEFKALEEKLGQVSEAKAQLQTQLDETRLNQLASGETHEKVLAHHQSKIFELEQALTQRHAEQVELQTSLASLQKDRQSLQETLDTERKAVALERTAWEATFIRQDQAALQQEAQLYNRLLDLQQQLNGRTEELQQMHHRYQDADQQRLAYEHSLGIQGEESARRYAELEKRFQSERSQSEQQQTQLAAQLSELKELKSSLADLRQERQTLLSTLEAERQKAQESLRAQGKESEDTQRSLQKRLDQLDADYRQKINVMSVEYQARINALESRTETLQAEAKHRFEELEKRFFVERDRLQQAETQLAAQVSELDSLHAELSGVKEERQALLSQLAAERQKAQADLKAGEKISLDARRVLQQRIEEIEKDFRVRMSEAAAESQTRMQALLQRAIGLEKNVAERDGEISRLRATLQEIQENLSTTQKDRLSLSEELDAQKKAFALERAAWDKATADLNKERVVSEDALHHRLGELQDQLSRKAAELQSLRVRLQESEQARAQMEKLGQEKSSESTQRLAELEKRFFAERDRVQQGESRLAEHLSELKSLRAELASVQGERRAVLQQLEAERDRTQAEWKAQEKLFQTDKRVLQDKLENQDKEYRQRMAAINAESAARIDSLQKRIRELEKSMVTQQSEFETRVEALQAERRHAETALQDRLIRLQEENSAQLMRQEQLQQALTASQSQNQHLEKLSAEAGTKAKSSQANLEKELQAAQVHMHQLQMELQSRSADLKEVQQTLAAAQKDRQALTESLQTQKKAIELERSAWESTVSENKQSQKKAIEALQSEWQIRFDAVEADARKTIEGLRSRMLDLEKESAEKALQLEETQTRVAQLDQKRQSLEAQLVHVSEERQSERQKLEKTWSSQVGQLEQRLGDMEKRFYAERERAEQGETRLTAQVSELESLRAELSGLKEERQALLAQLAAERQKALGEAKAAAQSSAEAQKALHARMEEIEREYKSRLAVVSSEASARADALQKRADQLEQALSKQKSEFEERLLGYQKERTALEQGLQQRLTDLQEQLARRATELQGLKLQWQESEQRRQQLEKSSGEQVGEAERRLAEFEKKFFVERDRVQQAQTLLAAQVSELDSLKAELDNSKAERQSLLSQLAAERQNAQAQMQSQTGESQQSQRAWREKLDKQEKDYRTRLEGLQTEFSARTENLQQRIRELEKTITTQQNDFDARLSASQAERRQSEAALMERLTLLQEENAAQLMKHEQLQQALTAAEHQNHHLEKLSQEASQQARAKQGTLEKELQEAQAHLHNVRRELQSRSTELKDVQQTLAMLQKDRQSLSEAFEVQKKAIVLERSAWDLTAADNEQRQAKALHQQQVEWQQRLEAVETESRKTMDGLRVRLVALEKESSSKAIQLQEAQTRFAELDQRRQSLEAQIKQQAELRQAESQQAEKVFSEQTRALEQRLVEMEKRFYAERDRAERGDTQLAAQRSELDSLKAELSGAKSERQTLLAQLASERQKAYADAQQLSHSTAEEKRSLEVHMSQMDREFRDRLTQTHAEAQARIDALQKRANELERELASKTFQLDEWRAHGSELSEKQKALETQMAHYQEERQQAQSAEAALHQRLLDVQDQLSRRSTDLQTLRQQLQESEKLRQSLEKSSDTKSGEARQRIDALERQMAADRQRAQQLETHLTARTSELKAIQSDLQGTRQEREQLLAELAAQREKAQAEMHSQEKESLSAQHSLQARLDVLDREYRQRLAEVSSNAERRIESLQKRGVELEKLMAEKESESVRSIAAQREEFERFISQLQEEHRRSESALQDRLLQVQEDAARQASHAAALEKDLQSAAQARDLMASRVSDDQASWKKQRDQLERNLSSARDHVHNLEQDVARRTETYNDLEKAMERLRKEHTELQNTVASQKKTWQQERSQLEGRVVEGKVAQQRAVEALEKQWHERFESLEAESQRTMEGLRARLLDFEKESAEKNLQLEEWKTRLDELDAAAKRLESEKHHWMERSASLESALASQKSEFEKRWAAYEASRAQLEETHRRKLEDLREQLARRTADVEAAKQLGEVRRLQEELELSRQERESLARTLEEQRMHFLEELKTKGMGAQDQERRFERELKAFEKDYKERMAAQTREQEARLVSQRQKIRELEESLASRNNAVSALEERVQTLDAERSRLDEARRQAQEHASDMKRQSEIREREFDQKQADTEEKLHAVQEQLRARQADLKTLQAQLKVAEEERNRLEKSQGQGDNSDQIPQLQARARTLEQEVSRRETEIDGLRSQVERLQESWAAREKELVKAHARDMEEAQSRFLEKMKDIRSESEEAVRRLQNEMLRHASPAASPSDRQEREELYEQLRNAQREISNLRAVKPVAAVGSGVTQALIEEWVFGFAHQVRNPLGIIRSIAESLKDSKAGSASRDSVEAILKAVDGLNGRLKEFIEFSKPVKPFIRTVDFQEAVTRAKESVRERLQKQRIDLKMNVANGAVRMDPDHLQIILVNLISNAIDSMPSGGKVRLEISNGSEGLTIRLQDHGKGIGKEHLKEVGRPFFSTKPGAVGLGLALIKRILRAYDGDMTVDSRQGQGTTVTCKLHIKEGEDQAWAA